MPSSTRRATVRCPKRRGDARIRFRFTDGEDLVLRGTETRDHADGSTAERRRIACTHGARRAGSCSIHQWPRPSSSATDRAGALARRARLTSRVEERSSDGERARGPGVGDVVEVGAPTRLPTSIADRYSVEDAVGHRLVERPVRARSPASCGTPNIVEDRAALVGGRLREVVARRTPRPSPGVCQILAKSCHSKSTWPMPAAVA